jgi:hypothetical protein
MCPSRRDRMGGKIVLQKTSLLGIVACFMTLEGKSKLEDHRFSCGKAVEFDRNFDKGRVVDFGPNGLQWEPETGMERKMRLKGKERKGKESVLGCALPFSLHVRRA